ncbi:MAG: endolytic transglycosylase MltG [Saprospiraceae bacterium]
MLKKILIALLLLALVASFIGYQKYQEIFAPNVPASLADPYLHIPTGTSYEELLQLLQKKNIVLDISSFGWLAEQMSYNKPTVRPGRYKIEPAWSNRALISHLRGGKQSPVKLVLNHGRLLSDVAGKAAQFIEADSMEIITLLSDPKTIEAQGFQPETFMSMFIPNTYEFFWNTSAEQFVARMKKEHNSYWSKNKREEKAATLGLSPAEVYTLASIVERESNLKSERPIIAGVYWNRIQRGMLLQADPTVVFATKEFGLRRVLKRHLEIDSPYNTYKYPGLPPGPISMASISSIDAVLNRAKHDYIFFCAKPDSNGGHAFAKNLAGHNANARRYHRWLNQRGI